MHLAIADSLQFSVSESTAKLLELLRWHTKAGCCWHDCHGAHKKGIVQYLKSKEVMTDSWAILESLRDSTADICLTIASWLPSVLTFKD